MDDRMSTGATGAARPSDPVGAQAGDLDLLAVRDLLEDAAARAASYLEGLDARPVRPEPDAVAALERLRQPLPDHGRESAEVLALLDELVSPATLRAAGRRFFGFVVGGALPVTLAAGTLAAAWDQNSSFHQTTPGTATLEAVALDWLLELLGLPAGTGAGFVTGATVANATALAAARHAVLERVGWDVEADGLFGAPPIRVVVGGEMHPTVRKSLGLLGMGKDRVERVPADDQGRFRADLLPELDGPAIVILQAGNVNTGAFDPLAEIVPRAHESGAWVHVDGAFGLWARVSPELRGLAAGLEGADSWATDFHKWLNVPYDSGIALVRDPTALAAAMAVTASYLPAAGRRDPSDFTPELSRRARGVEVWAALARLGRSGVREMVERCCRHARRFAEGLTAAGFDVLNEVALNQVLVSFGTPERTRDVIAALQDDGTCWCGGTEWQGRTAMRISVSSWATTEEDVERCLEVMIRLARHADAGTAG
ncbi:MAG: aminotransferase class V-fold PLP-dependent enzyme [Deinococcales bacterium]